MYIICARADVYKRQDLCLRLKFSIMICLVRFASNRALSLIHICGGGSSAFGDKDGSGEAVDQEVALGLSVGVHGNEGVDGCLLYTSRRARRVRPRLHQHIEDAIIMKIRERVQAIIFTQILIFFII